MKLSEKEFWAVVEKAGWEAHKFNYGAIKKELVASYTLGKMEDFRADVGEKYAALEARFDEWHRERGNMRNLGFPFGGDDSFMDMIHHVIGMGEAFYKKAMKNPEVMKNISPRESFSYCIPSKEDYPGYEDTFEGKIRNLMRRVDEDEEIEKGTDLGLLFKAWRKEQKEVIQLRAQFFQKDLEVWDMTCKLNDLRKILGEASETLKDI